MVARASEALQINTGGGVQAQQSGIGFVNPNTDATSQNRVASNPADGMHESSSTRILSRILDMGGKLTQQKFKQNTEEAYLSGVAKAGTIESEDQLNANPITKDWEVAGYRDTMGRVATADNEAQIATDMHQMREKSPEEFGNYLAERRTKVMASWEGMTAPVRQTMFAQQLLSERAAIKRHAAEHYKFAEEVEYRAIKANLDTSFSALEAAKVDLPTYQAATDSAYATVYSGVGVNPKLRNEARGKLIAENAHYALETDNQMLYDQIMNKTGRLADGSQGTLGSLVSREDSIALAKAARISKERTAGVGALKYHTELALDRADWDNPNTPLQSYQEVQKIVADGHARGYFGTGLESATKAAAVMADYARAAVKKEKVAGLANAFVNGDVNAVNKANGTRVEALAAWQTSVGSKLPLAENVGKLLNQGITHGWPESLAQAGTVMRPAWAQLSTLDDINPENAKMVHGVVSAITNAEAAGKQGVMQQYISAFDAPTQELILRVRSNAAAGYGPTEAIQRARSSLLEENKAGNSGLTAAIRQQADKDNALALSTITPVGMFGGAWGAIKSVFSNAQAQKHALQVHADYWENPSRVAENEGMVKSAVAQELSDISRDRPYMAAPDRATLANTRVVQRSVITPWGPLIAPKGQTNEQVYGVKDPERIASALEQIVKPADGNRVSFQFDVNGQLMVSERNGKDGLSKSYRINPMDVAKVAEDQRKKEEAHYRVLAGDGTTVGAVKFDGVNALGVDMQSMYDLRARLLKHEGYSDTAKPDVGGAINKKTGKPVMTVGPGLSDTGTFYPKVDKNGRITPAQASQGLQDASEEAAKYAMNWQIATRTRDNPKGFQLLAELAYQGGGGNKAMNPLLTAIKNRDKKAAIPALEATPQWQMAHKERRAFYSTTLNSLME